MSERLTLDQLRNSEKALRTKEVSIEGRGTLLVRAFSKAESRVLRSSTILGGEVDADKLEIGLFRLGVIEPDLSELTDEEIIDIFDKWAATEVDQVLFTIMELNGWTENFMREQMIRFQDGARGAVQVPSSS